MPSLIKKRGKKRWRGNVQVDDVVRQKLFPDDSKKSERDAIIWENETRKKLVEELSGTHSISWTVLDWANEYLAEAEERYVKKTFGEKRFVFSNLLKTVKPITPLEDLTPFVALKYLRAQAKKRSGNASNKDRKNLGAAWNWGQKFMPGFPQEINPFLAVDKFPEKRSPRYIPPEEDFWAVYNEAEGQDQVMLFTFLHLAARRNEIFGLTWEDVDFGNGRVRLWTNKRMGGHRESDWLPMTKKLREVLLKWWEDRPIKDVSHVFVCLEEVNFLRDCYGKPFVARQHFMRRLCRKAGVKAFGFHAIRHLAATILYQQGEPVSLIQAVLRHQNPNTTTRYLNRLGLEQVRDGLDKAMKGPAEVIPFKKRKAGNE